MRKLSTEEILRGTIKELMTTRSLDAISVQDILEASGISRATFYKHFYDKQDLMEYAFKKELVEENFCDFSRTLEEREVVCLEYLRENRGFYLNALKTAGQKSFYDMWIQSAYETLRGYFRHILAKGAIDEGDLDFVCRFTAYGWVNMNIDWLREENGETPTELSGKLSRMLERGMDAFLKK